MRFKPAAVAVLAGVLAGVGAGATWSVLSAQQPDGPVSSAGPLGAVHPRPGDRASRDDSRDLLVEPTEEVAGVSPSGDGSGTSPTSAAGPTSTATADATSLPGPTPVTGTGSSTTSGAGSVLSLNPLDLEALPDLAAARPQPTGGTGTDDEAPAVDAADLAASDAVAQVLPEGVDEVDFAAGILSTVVPETGTGVLDVVPGSTPAPGTGEISTVRVQVEQGLDVDGTKVADLVLATLNDPRSWGGDGSRTFARTDAADATFTVTLASPSTVDTLCAPLDTGGLWSCGVTDHAVLNYLRWVEGSPNYGEDMAAYRQYLVNHEVGHVLGHRHEQCGSTDSLAPVMVQQSGAAIRCVPNGWPRP